MKEYTTLNWEGTRESFSDELVRLNKVGWEVISSNAYVAFTKLTFYALLFREKPAEEKEPIKRAQSYM